MAIKTISWVNGRVKIIDQRKLPGKLEYIHCRDVKTLWSAIRSLAVRGAPAIGVAAAFGVLLGTRNFKGQDRDKFVKLAQDTCDYLSTSRPTAVNLFNMLARMKTVIARHPNAGVDQLKEVDVKGVEPTSHPLSLSNVFREDRPVPSLPIEEFLKTAPSAKGRFFQVPKVIEDK